MTETFRVSPEVLWQALPASLPSVTQQATWYESSHKVEWTVELTGWTWTQVMTVTVEPEPGGFAKLTFTGKSPYRSAIGDKGRRKHVFDTLVAALNEALAHPLTTPVEQHTLDEFRWWNGQQWTYEPPPTPPTG